MSKVNDVKFGEQFDKCRRLAGFKSLAQLAREVTKRHPELKGSEESIAKQFSKYRTMTSYPPKSGESYYEIATGIFYDVVPDECQLLEQLLENEMDSARNTTQNSIAKIVSKKCKEALLDTECVEYCLFLTIIDILTTQGNIIKNTSTTEAMKKAGESFGCNARRVRYLMSKWLDDANKARSLKNLEPLTFSKFSKYVAGQIVYKRMLVQKNKKEAL